MKKVKRITGLVLALLITISIVPPSALAQSNTGVSLGSSTTKSAPPNIAPLGFSITPFALGDYETDDVAVINKMITDNGLVATLDDPDSWRFAHWDTSLPKRLTELNLTSDDLEGALELNSLTSLEVLYLSNNYLTTLDLSGLTNLVELECMASGLTSLNVSGLTSLEELNCNYNYLTELDVRSLTNLKNLDCGLNQLTSLYVTGLTNLEMIKCGENLLTNLDLTGLTSLEVLDCWRNLLSSLNLSGLTSFMDLYAQSNRLTSLIVSDVPSCEYIDCVSNELTELNLINLPNLDALHCTDNQLTELDVSGLINMGDLYCNENQLTELDLTGLNNIEWLNFSRNKITSVDINHLSNLRSLRANSNELTELDLTGLTKLKALYCNDNELTELDLTGLTKLEDLYCNENELTELDLTGLTKLEDLYCNENKLTSLDASGLTSLERLDCRYNDMPNQSALTGVVSTVVPKFEPQNETGFQRVKSISGLPRFVVIDTPLDLESVVVHPSNANNKNIVWSLEYGSADITGNTLTARASGIFYVTATIENGRGPNEDYVDGFHILAVPATSLINKVIVDGGSGAGSYYFGEAVNMTANVPAGQGFKEWQTTPEVAFDNNTDKYSSTASFAMPAYGVTATAIFDNLYTVTVQTYGNGTATSNIPEGIPGKTVNLVTTPSAGYRFKEWQVISGGVIIVDNSFNMPNSNVTVKAIFELIPPNEYAIILETEGDGSVAASKTSAPMGETITLTATPGAGYNFKEWQVISGGVNIANNSFVMPDSAVTVKAIFELIPSNDYTIVLETDGNGSAVSNKTSALAGETINLTATPNNGYRFKEWRVISGGVNIVNNSFVMPNSAVMVKAVFEPIPAGEYAIILETDGNGSVAANKTSAPVGETINLTATPNTGYRFKEWKVISGGVNIVNNSFIMPNSAVMVKAVFEPIPAGEYAIILETDGNGSVVASKTSAPSGETINLTATPNTGYRFKEWQVVSGGVNIVNNSFVMANNTVTVKAVFEANSTPPPVTLVPQAVGTTASRSFSSGGSSTKVDVRPAISTDSAFTKAEATKLFNTALAEKADGATTLSMRARNYTKVDKSVLVELADLAKKNGVTLTVYFDTVVNKAVIYRLSINPAVVKTNLDLTANIVDNKITMPKLVIPTKVAVKMPAGATLENLKITQNGRDVTESSKPWIDANMYVHFTTTGGKIVLAK